MHTWGKIIIIRTLTKYAWIPKWKQTNKKSYNLLQRKRRKKCGIQRNTTTLKPRYYHIFRISPFLILALYVSINTEYMDLKNCANGSIPAWLKINPVLHDLSSMQNHNILHVRLELTIDWYHKLVKRLKGAFQGKFLVKHMANPSSPYDWLNADHYCWYNLLSILWQQLSMGLKLLSDLSA